MRGLAALLPLALASAGAPAGAQSVATSAGPTHVAVTVYRDPNRSVDQGLNLRWLNGYALISETRRVRLPAGEVALRFEGVAGGIVPQSAIVTGLPEGVIERNRDAYLLSPATLLDRSLGRRVHLRRTSRATGAVRDQDAVIRTSAAGAAVIETEGGFEALRCTGLPETIVYDGVPAGLSARPTLSVRARSRRPIDATVTLSYLATGFDWQANYVATLAPDGAHLALFAWLTLANGDETGFVRADTQAVAGRLNRSFTPPQPSEGGPLTLHCWPQGTTSDIPLEEAEEIVVNGLPDVRMSMVMPPPPPPPPPMMAPAAMQARQEELGDLKLYRIPEPVTVAAHSQKQVALLQRPEVQVSLVYRSRFSADSAGASQPAGRVLVFRNRIADGLGVPLPAGRLMLFAAGSRPILLGQGSVRDRAVGEDVEVEVGPAYGVRARLRQLSGTAQARDYELVVINDHDAPVAYEAEFFENVGAVFESDPALERRNDIRRWSVSVPANGRMTLRYRVMSPTR